MKLLLVDYLHTNLRIGGDKWVEVFQRQVDSWLEFLWVAVPYDPNNHGESFSNAGRAMAQRKYARPFVQVDEPGDKCTLTGAQTALPLDWEGLSKRLGGVVVRSNEKLGAIATIKRFAQAAGCFGDDAVERFPSANAIAANDRNKKDQDDDASGSREVEGYLAILHMDGDQMGAALGAIKKLKEHQDFSRVLAGFADNEVEPIIEEHCRRDDGSDGAGVLVYAGGDDVLALLPLSKALACADALRKKFEEVAKAALPTGRMTMSAGLSIVPHKLPFDIGLDTARRAEETAKDRFRVFDRGNPSKSKGAIYVVESHGTGQREAGGCWEDIGFVDQFQAYFRAGDLSGKYGYDLLELHQTLGGEVSTSRWLAEMKLSEAKRIIRRRAKEGLGESDKARMEDKAEHLAQFAQMLDAHGPTTDGWRQAANWVILARFLATDGKRGG